MRSTCIVYGFYKKSNSKTNELLGILSYPGVLGRGKFHTSLLNMNAASSVRAEGVM